jgi:hypothetical protein
VSTRHDPVTAPAHYTVYPVQPIAITRHLSFCLGNAVKYVLRAPHKGGAEDLRKAEQYLIWEMETPGTEMPHRIYLEVEAAIDAIVNHLVLPRSQLSDLQTSCLLNLDQHLATGNYADLYAMKERVREMIDLLESEK